MVAGRKCTRARLVILLTLFTHLSICLSLSPDETTANSIAFVLYELARHPEIQEQVRNEILSIKSRTGGELSVNEFEAAMPYTKAVIKEGLRLHPVVYGPFLHPAENDVIPLSKPIRAVNGKMINEVPIGKGQVVHISVSGYNR
jgi:cytochrome P450